MDSKTEDTTLLKRFQQVVYKKNQKDLLHNFATILKHDKTKQIIWFKLNDNFKYNTEMLQRAPFNYFGVNQRYQYMIEAVLLSKVAIINPDFVKKIGFMSSKSAVLSDIGSLLNFNASHPKFGKFYYNIKENDNPNDKNKRFQNIHQFYDDKNFNNLILEREVIWIMFYPTKYKKLQKNRKKNRIINNNNNNKKNFQLNEYPSMLGHNSLKMICLSELKLKVNEKNNEMKIYCDGYGDYNNLILKHPYFWGSADHINAQHFAGIIYQFANLMVRNGKNKLFTNLNNFFINIKYFDCNSILTIFDWKLNFIKYVEFGNFQICLKELYLTKPINMNTKEVKIKTLFRFYFKASLIQNNIECQTAVVGVCPLFLPSLL